MLIRHCDECGTTEGVRGWSDSSRVFILKDGTHALNLDLCPKHTPTIGDNLPTFWQNIGLYTPEPMVNVSKKLLTEIRDALEKTRDPYKRHHRVLSELKKYL